MFTGLKAITHFGRPQFEQFLDSLQMEHSDVCIFQNCIKIRNLRIRNRNLYCIRVNNGVGLGNRLFVKVTRPGDSEGTFAVIESSCHLLLPV